MIQRYEPRMHCAGDLHSTHMEYVSDGEYIKLSDVLALLDKEKEPWNRGLANSPNVAVYQVRANAAIQTIDRLRAELGAE